MFAMWEWYDMTTLFYDGKYINWQVIISNTMTRGTLVIKFPASRGRVCGSPDAVGGGTFINSPETWGKFNH